MCLDYLWVSNPYGPSTTQPRPKIKTFLGAQATLILFNVPAPYHSRWKIQIWPPNFPCKSDFGKENLFCRLVTVCWTLYGFPESHICQQLYSCTDKKYRKTNPKAAFFMTWLPHHSSNLPRDDWAQAAFFTFTTGTKPALTAPMSPAASNAPCEVKWQKDLLSWQR